MIKIMLADDHSLVREGIRRVLETATDMQVVAEAADGTEALRLAATHALDVVVMDLSMPNIDGLELARRLIKGSSSPRIVVLSVHSAFVYAERMIDLGASAYVPKHATSDELIEAIRVVHTGRVYIAKALKGTINSEGHAMVGIQSLTNRELQIARLLAGGSANGQIARELGMSVKTVSVHRLNVLAKLRLRNNTELARFSIASGLLADV